jgi:hypothetical protein
MPLLHYKQGVPADAWSMNPLMWGVQDKQSAFEAAGQPVKAELNSQFISCGEASHVE